MKNRQRIPRRQLLALQNLYAQYYADSLEYCEEHLAFLRVRRNEVLRSLEA